MDDPLPSYEGIAAAFAKAKAEKEKEEASGLKGRTDDAKAANKQGELRFKAAHGLLIAFFTWIL
jgi:phosphatidylinositol glycan class O